MVKNSYQSDQENLQQENFYQSDFNQQNSNQEFFNQNNQQFIKPEYAGFWIRFAANIIDGVIYMPINWAFFYIIGPNKYNDLNVYNMANVLLFIFKTIPYLIPFFVYQVYFLSSRRQATPGKRILGIYVGNSQDGSKISICKSFFRFIIHQIFLLTTSFIVTFITFNYISLLHFTSPLFIFLYVLLLCFLVNIDVLIVAFTKEKTALHDLICGTRVFYGRKN